MERSVVREVDAVLYEGCLLQATSYCETLTEFFEFCGTSPRQIQGFVGLT